MCIAVSWHYSNPAEISRLKFSFSIFVHNGIFLINAPFSTWTVLYCPVYSIENKYMWTQNCFVFCLFFHYLLLQNLMKYLFVGLSRQLLFLCTHLHTYIHTYISTYICFLVPHEFVVLFPSVSGFALLRTYSTYNRNENVLYKQPNIQLYSLLFNTRKKRNGKSWAHWV